jgi:hypothetical protein
LSRYHPECVVFNEKGEQIACVGPSSRKNADFGMNYQDDFRDTALKINDDCKIQI